MKRLALLTASVSACGLALSAQLVGCFNSAADCDLNPKLRCGAWAVPVSGATTTSTTTGGGGGAGGGGGGTGGDGGGGGIPAGCVPSDIDMPVASTCGVFVSSSLGDDSNEGSKSAPLASLAVAIGKASTKGVPLYACAETFVEAVALGAPVTIYGGLDCAADWAYVGPTKKSLLMGKADEVPLRMSAEADGTAIYDFTIQAADATAPGGSSIAIIADAVKAAIVRCDVVAGNGATGAVGMTPMDSVGPTDPSDATIVGNSGATACASATSQLGGDPKENPLCPAANGGPIGGLGGSGLIASGANGEANPATSQTALGGQGQPASDPTWSCAVGGGAVGSNGAPGTSGTGASGLGELSASGFLGVPGGAGGLGAPAQGGGGGGGAKGKALCAGASGGGGGAGGCGGNGGLGGQAGGASIGIASIGATLTFTGVTITTGQGGSGGDGGDGQGGGVGGNGGNGGIGDANVPATLKACNGGAGGQGGFGGKGGGGQGGHSVGLAYTGAVGAIEGLTIVVGTPGPGGLGGDLFGQGIAGSAVQTLGF